MPSKSETIGQESAVDSDSAVKSGLSPSVIAPPKATAAEPAAPPSSGGAAHNESLADTAAKPATSGVNRPIALTPTASADSQSARAVVEGPRPATPDYGDCPADER